MTNALYIAAGLLVLVGAAHSYLGERYILQRLFARESLPKLFGSQEFTKRTLRLAWHLSTVTWLGFAIILVSMAESSLSTRLVGMVIGCTFLIHFLVALIGSRGRHLSWIVFLAVGLIAIFATAI